MTGKAGQSRRPAKTSGSRMGLLGVGILILFVAAGIALAITGDEPTERTEVAPVEITGDALPKVPDQASADDPAIGMDAPQVSGVNFDGQPTDLLNPDGGTMIVFMAHWCPHCRRELPVLVDELTPDNVPDNVRVVAVSTFSDPAQANYPASAWLERGDWPFPVVVDSEESEIMQAYGAGGTPLFVVVADDGTVQFRGSGEFAPEQLQQLIDLAAGA